MRRYLLRRLALLAGALLLASSVLFLVLRVLPGDPVNTLLSLDASPEDIQRARAELGSDRPLGEQYLHWMGQMFRGDLGTSFFTGESVSRLIGERLPVTVPLTLVSFVLAVLVAVPVGFVAAHRRDTWYGTAFSAFAQLGIAVPVFWVGILLVWIFALWLRALPPGGFPLGDWADPGAASRSLVLPVVTIVIVMSSGLARYVRSAALDVINQEYIRTSRALGFSFRTAMLRHGVRNGAVPVVAILGIELATTFLGAVVVENVFALPGLGSLLLTAIKQNDFPVVQGVLFLSTVIVLVVGFAADLVQRAIDPRLRRTLADDVRIAVAEGDGTA